MEDSTMRSSLSRNVHWIAALSIFLISFTSIRINRELGITRHDLDEALPKASVRQIAILGERNSGTRWIYDHISLCFNHSIVVKKNLTRYKHWFQYENPDAYLHNTLVLAQFRNPYTWLKSMQHVPHHAPAHLRTKTNFSSDRHDAGNDWKVFLTKPWTTDRVGLDLTVDGNPICQDNFRYNDVVSCHQDPLPSTYYQHKLRFSENQPFYEMRNDGSGKPYANILEMRTDKIRNFLSVAQYQGVSDLWTIQYEFLLTNGTQYLLDRISKATGVTPLCDAYQPQGKRKSRRISLEFARHIRKHLNWTVENSVGYDIEVWREIPDATTLQG